MTNRMGRASRGTAHRVVYLAAFALLSLCLPGAASAQWTTPDAAGNISTTNTGNVGVGTNAPTAKLHVAGDITVDGNINAKYQDVAEWVPSTQRLAAGTVVVLDPERPNHVLASDAPYDTAVAGVISARPGLTLGEAGEGKALVATTGRVKVRVDATKGPIKVGDLLVTSGMPGVAMKSQPLDLGGCPSTARARSSARLWSR